MNTAVKRMDTAYVSAPAGMTELVRGSDLKLVVHVEPLARATNVILNFEPIERIDAAGIAALISLYGSARDAGYTFRVCNVRAHVEEVLSLVGLDDILVAGYASWGAPVHTELTQTAA